MQQALAARSPEDRFLLAAYFLDQRTLFQISKILEVHEATVSRRIHRLVADLRKDLLARLQAQGLSQRAAEEALSTDPRDLTPRHLARDSTSGEVTPHDLDQQSSNLRNLLQFSQFDSFQEKTGQ